MSGADSWRPKGLGTYIAQVVGGAILAAVLWAGSVLQAHGQELARVAERLEAVNADLSMLKTQNDRYRETDAARDFALRDAEIRSLRRLIEGGPCEGSKARKR